MAGGSEKAPIPAEDQLADPGSVLYRRTQGIGGLDIPQIDLVLDLCGEKAAIRRKKRRLAINVARTAPADK